LPLKPQNVSVYFQEVEEILMVLQIPHLTQDRQILCLYPESVLRQDSGTGHCCMSYGS